ncbi:hypothetical protein GGI42DRAFT_365272, partial [Trichoderma sp. SZMC 28013]
GPPRTQWDGPCVGKTPWIARVSPRRSRSGYERWRGRGRGRGAIRHPRKAHARCKNCIFAPLDGSRALAHGYVAKASGRGGAKVCASTAHVVPWVVDAVRHVPWPPSSSTCRRGVFWTLRRIVIGLRRTRELWLGRSSLLVPVHVVALQMLPADQRRSNTGHGGVGTKSSGRGTGSAAYP